MLTAAPELGWSVEVAYPFSGDASKNVMWQPLKDGRVIQRKTTTEYLEGFGQALQAAFPPDVQVVEHRLWLDLMVEKPSNRSDALNVLDTIADTVQQVTGLDDRWYCVSRLDWTINKDDPHIWLAVGQEVDAAPSQVCGACGDILALSTDHFTRDRSAKRGFSNTCKRCQKERRLAQDG